ncbi:MAG: hypothetical protein WCI45_01595 [Desulfuromonadales bacterium]
MQKFVKYILAVFIVISLSACGGSSTTTAATVVYDLVPVLAPANTHMGGSIQGGTITAKFTNYSVSTLPVFANTSTTTKATFNHPTDITYNWKNNSFYVADYGNNLIRQILPSGIVSTLQCTTDGTIPAHFNGPSSITTDGDNLYVVDSVTNTIRFIEIATNKVTIIGSTAGLSGSIDVSVLPPATTADITLARFKQPTGITTDGVSLYVTDSGNQTVRRIDIASRAVSTLAGTSGAIGSTNDTAAAARFYTPGRITNDGVNLYLTDFNNRNVRMIDILTGAVTTIAGSSGQVGTDDGTLDGIGIDARFNQPNGIATDGAYIYVTDSYHNTVRRIDKSPEHNVTTISGIAKTGGVGGAVDSPGSASFYTPIGITTNGTSLYIADTFNNAIRKMQ